MTKEVDIDIKSLISQMTLKEKVGQLNQKLYGWNAYRKTNDGYELTEEFKEHVKWGGGLGVLYGTLRADAWSGVNFYNGISREDSIIVTNMIRDYVRENTRLKIPVLFSEECPHGHQALGSEMYPCSINMGSTWNTKLVEKISKEISNEISAKGCNLALVSTLDVLRDPRWGRSEECLSEDPYLSSRLNEGIVKGYTNDNGVTVVLKHLCAQGAPVGGHNSGAANIGERELRDIFLPPVKAAVKSGALAVMAAYNEIDGVPCHGNKRLLNNILRDEYGFKGIVMADGCALDRLIMMTGDTELAAKIAIEAGVDLSLWDNVYTSLENAVENGLIEEKTIDIAVERVLNLKKALGLFKDDRVIPKLEKSKYNKQAALESLVLLKNNGVLPLKCKEKIAVVGPNAHNKYNQLGDYTSPQKEENIITVLEGIQNICGDNIVNYSRGCSIREEETNEINEAIKICSNSEVAIVVVGGSSSRNMKMSFESNGAVKTSYDKYDMNCGENVDLANLDLEGKQVKLIKEIKKTGIKVVTVLIQGRPHSIENILEESDAIICAWYPGIYGGEAIAETIFGINNPSGKLPVSIPRSSMQLPCYYNGKDSGAKIDYVDMEGTSLYPFGYGLSYSNFKYSNLKLKEKVAVLKELKNGKNIELSVTVINESDIDGYEIVELYIKDLESTITQRVKELKGFSKILLKAREKKEVQFTLSYEDLSIWDINLINQVEKGRVKIMVGTSSEEYLEEIVEII